MAHAFISYSRVDQPFVRKLSEHLRQAGRESWVDWEGIAPSVKWMEEIRAAIDAADAFVFVISPDAVASRVCGEELQHALQARKRILPVVARAAENVPAPVAEINWITFAHPDDPQAIQRLVTAMDTDPAWVSEHTRLTQRSRQWEQAGREASLLLRGKDLVSAEAWLGNAAKHAAPKPTELQTAYIIESRTQQARSQRRQLMAAATAVVVSMALAVWAVIERNDAADNARLALEREGEAKVQRASAQRNEKLANENAELARQRQREAEHQAALARARELSALAISSLEADPEVSLHLSLASLDRQATPQGEEAMVRALQASRLQATLGDDCEVVKAEFGAAGRHVLGTCSDGSVRVWTVQGELRLKWAPPRAKVTDATLSADEAQLFVAADDGHVLGVRLADGKTLLRRTAGTARQPRLALSPDGRQLYAFGGSGGVQVFATPGLEPLHRLEGEPGTVHWLRFPNDGQRVALFTARDPRTLPKVRFWKRTTGEAIQDQGGHEAFPGGALFSSDGTRLLTKGGDEIDEHWAPEVWDLAAPRKLGTLNRAAGRWSVGTVDSRNHVFMSHNIQNTLQIWSPPSGGSTAYGLTMELAGHTDSITSVALFPRDEPDRILTGSGDGTARLWQRKEGAALLAVLRGHRGAVAQVSFSPDGLLALSVGVDRTAKVWRLHDPRLGPAWRVAGGDASWRMAAADAQGRVVALLSSEGQLRLADTVDKRVMADLWPFGGAGKSADKGKLRVALSASGDRMLVRGALTGKARIVDVPSGRVRCDFAGAASSHDDQFTPDGSRVLMAGGVPLLIDATHCAIVTRLRGSRAYIGSYEFSQDGSKLVARDVAFGREVVLYWPLAPGENPPYLDALAWPAKRQVKSHALSPDGRRLATGDDRNVEVWDVATRQVLFTRPFVASALAFSRDGRRIAALDSTRGLRIWDADDGQERLSRLPWSDHVDGLAFSADGRLLLARGVVISATTGLLVNAWMGDLGQGWNLSADGQRLFSEVSTRAGSLSKAVEVVDCVPCQPLLPLAAYARQRLARSALSRHELEQFGLLEKASGQSAPTGAMARGN